MRSPARTSGAAAILAHADRYRRAEEFVDRRAAVLGQLGSRRRDRRSWTPESTSTPTGSARVEHRGPQFDVRGVATLPAGPQGHPVLLQAGDSADGRDFGAAHADALFTPHSALEAGQRYYADVKARAAAHGRDPNQLKVLPAATFVLGDTAGRGRREGAAHPPPAGHGPQTAIAMLEQVWERDLSGLRPRRSAARRRSARRPDGHPGPGPPRRPEGRGRRMARAGRGREPVASANWSSR